MEFTQLIAVNHKGHFMKKRSFVKCLIPLVPFLILILFLLYLFIPGTTHTWDHTSCKYLFGVTPEEFMKTEFEFYSETGDFRKSAKIDKEGNLSVTLSLFQEYRWEKTEWLSGFSEYPDKEPFVISSNYKKLDLYLPSDIDYSSEHCQLILRDYHTILAKMGTMQRLNGVHDDNVYVEFTIINKDTGEIIYSKDIKT